MTYLDKVQSAPLVVLLATIIVLQSVFGMKFVAMLAIAADVYDAAVTLQYIGDRDGGMLAQLFVELFNNARLGIIVFKAMTMTFWWWVGFRYFAKPENKDAVLETLTILFVIFYSASALDVLKGWRGF